MEEQGYGIYRFGNENKVFEDVEILYSRLINEALQLNYINLDKNIRSILFSSSIDNSNQTQKLGIDYFLLKGLLSTASLVIVVDRDILYIDGEIKLNLNTPLKPTDKFRFLVEQGSQDIDTSRLIKIDRIRDLERLMDVFYLKHNVLNAVDTGTSISSIIQTSIDTSKGITNVAGAEEKAVGVMKKLLRALKLNRIGKKDAILTENNTSVKLLEAELSKFDYAYTVVAQEVASITGRSLTWFLGRSPQGFNATGESEEIQNQKANKSFASKNVLPLLNEIQARLGSDKIVSIGELDYEAQYRLEGIGNFPIIDGSLTEEQAWKYKRQVLGAEIMGEEFNPNIEIGYQKENLEEVIIDEER